MSILIDNVREHDSSNAGDETVPPGISGSVWCHIASGAAPGEPAGTGSLAELQAFLTDNLAAIGCDPSNIRTPQDTPPSRVTYAGLSQDQRAAAITAGAHPMRQTYIIGHVFDAQSPPTTYEP